MIKQLDDVIEALLTRRAPEGSKLKEAAISFDLPDAEWRLGLVSGELMVNCYLYDVKENRELRRPESMLRMVGETSVRCIPPVRIDCSYCITAWSPAANKGASGISATPQEHELLSDVLTVLFANIDFAEDIKDILLEKWHYPDPPRPLKIASQDGIKNQAEFWGALNQQLKPSINYVVNIAMSVGEIPTAPPSPKVLELTGDNKKVWDEKKQ